MDRGLTGGLSAARQEFRGPQTVSPKGQCPADTQELVVTSAYSWARVPSFPSEVTERPFSPRIQETLKPILL